MVEGGGALSFFFFFAGVEGRGVWRRLANGCPSPASRFEERGGGGSGVGGEGREGKSNKKTRDDTSLNDPLA